MVRFAAFGDYGVGGGGEAEVASLVDLLDVDFIVTTGDNSYSDNNTIDQNVGQFYSSYIGSYKGQFGTGSEDNRFFPVPGNHDYHNGGGIDAYTDYFTLPGNERYYDFRVGNVHFFAVDDFAPEGTSADSPQGLWLKAALAASDATFKVVYNHVPPHSSGAYGAAGNVSDPYWQHLEEWGATAVLSGHDHRYERIMRDNNGDSIEIPYFITGLGGHPRIHEVVSATEGQAAVYNADFGTMIVEATETAMTFAFYSVADGGTLIDSYTWTVPVIDDLLGDAEGNVISGTSMQNRIAGLDGSDKLKGYDGDDILQGGNGDDVLIGGRGDDVLQGGGGADVLIGGSGRDDARYNDALAGVLADLQVAARNTGSAEGDTYQSIENLSGSNHGDRLFGNSAGNHIRGLFGNDTIHGRGGDDFIFGNEGDDVLRGGAGSDRLGGGEGNDWLEGGIGTDWQSGGSGSDSYFFASALHGGDSVAGFTSGEDSLKLKGAGFGFARNEALADSAAFIAAPAPQPIEGSATFLYDTGTGELWFDSDGTGSAAAQLLAILVGSPQLAAADLQFV